MPFRLSRSMLTPLIIATALFMENMDATVIATSLPAIAVDLGVDPIALKLALTSYLVSLAVFIPLSGWMADRYGARRVFRAAIVVFSAGSLLCACSQSLAGFVLARFIQGIGGAMMVPVGKLVILRTTEKSQLVRAMSYLTIPALLGPVVGPPLGGFISTYFHWRWIFLINLPIGLLGLLLAGRYIENLRDDKVPPLDWLGFALTGLGLSLAMLGLATEGKHMLTVGWSTTLAITGGLLLAAYPWHARRHAHPLLDLSLLRIPTFHASLIGGFLFRVGMGSTPFLLPLMLQLGFGLTPFQSGLLTCSTALGAMFMKTIVGHVLQRFGFRQVLLVNSLLCGLSFAGYGLFDAHSPHWLMLATFLLGGCMRSLQFTSLNAIAFADIDHGGMSHASTLSSVAMQLASGLGVTIAAFALQGISRLQAHATLQVSDFSWSFVIMGVLAMLSAWQFRHLHPHAGAALARPAANEG
ncbi:DHA2 family efflux MFS transporter permease subunit [Vogesella sp. GCM10023246]|uniref:DHA2 family efflux MFS transporter permease subunit n=1 Tax=Vogesella oryzagri TaxID=3160864 RepID=A0ABV1M8E4_9NEIS